MQSNLLHNLKFVWETCCIPETIPLQSFVFFSTYCVNMWRLFDFFSEGNSPRIGTPFKNMGKCSRDKWPAGVMYLVSRRIWSQVFLLTPSQTFFLVDPVFLPKDKYNVVNVNIIFLVLLTILYGGSRRRTSNSVFNSLCCCVTFCQWLPWDIFLVKELWSECGNFNHFICTVPNCCINSHSFTSSKVSAPAFLSFLEHYLLVSLLIYHVWVETLGLFCFAFLLLLVILKNYFI